MDAQLVGLGIGWVETDRALLVTRDAGQTWHDATPDGLTFRDGPGPLWSLHASSSFRSLDAVDAQTALIATDVVGPKTTTVRIWRTSDGGRMWHWADLPSVPHLTGDICGDLCGAHAKVLLDAVDSRDIFAELEMVTGMDSISHDIYRSLDGGRSWKRMPWDQPDESSPTDIAIHFLTADAGTVLWGTRIFSTDRGWGQWTVFDDQGGPVTFVDGRHWIIAGTVPSLESFDAGRTWAPGTGTDPTEPGVQADVIVTPVDATTWIALISRFLDPVLGGQGPVETWISTNAGRTWTFVANQPTTDPRRSTFLDRFHAWVLDDTGGLASTSDGGATWSPIGP